MSLDNLLTSFYATVQFKGIQPLMLAHSYYRMFQLQDATIFYHVTQM